MLQPCEPSRASETDRFKPFTYDELVGRDKASLDIFWLRDESLEDTENLPPPGMIAAEIVEDLEAALGRVQRNRINTRPAKTDRLMNDEIQWVKWAGLCAVRTE